jgi:hypothetical protein
VFGVVHQNEINAGINVLSSVITGKPVSAPRQTLGNNAFFQHGDNAVIYLLVKVVMVGFHFILSLSGHNINFLNG